MPVLRARSRLAESNACNVVTAERQRVKAEAAIAGGADLPEHGTKDLYRHARERGYSVWVERSAQHGTSGLKLDCYRIGKRRPSLHWKAIRSIA